MLAMARINKFSLLEKNAHCIDRYFNCRKYNVKKSIRNIFIKPLIRMQFILVFLLSKQYLSNRDIDKGECSFPVLPSPCLKIV